MSNLTREKNRACGIVRADKAPPALDGWRDRHEETTMPTEALPPLDMRTIRRRTTSMEPSDGRLKCGDLFERWASLMDEDPLIARDLARDGDWPDPWRKLSCEAEAERQLGNLGRANELLRRADGFVRTRNQRSRQQGNRALHRMSCGRPREAWEIALEGVDADPGHVSPAINALCAASQMRSRTQVLRTLEFLSRRAPDLLIHEELRKSWNQDPQIAWARLALSHAPQGGIHR